jgi:hypothetical protein
MGFQNEKGQQISEKLRLKEVSFSSSILTGVYLEK